MEFMTDEMKMMEANETPSRPRTESEWQELVNRLNEELAAKREENEILRSVLGHRLDEVELFEHKVNWLKAKAAFLSAKLDAAEFLLGGSIQDKMDKLDIEFGEY